MKGVQTRRRFPDHKIQHVHYNMALSCHTFLRISRIHLKLVFPIGDVPKVIYQCWANLADCGPTLSKHYMLLAGIFGAESSTHSMVVDILDSYLDKHVIHEEGMLSSILCICPSSEVTTDIPQQK